MIRRAPRSTRRATSPSRSFAARARRRSSPPRPSPRRSASRSPRTTTSNSVADRVLLAIDVGNTQTVLGLYDGDRLTEHRRLATEGHRTGDELGALYGRLLDLGSLSGICLSSTVPRLVREYEELAERWTRAPLLVVGPGIRTGITMRYEAPREIGPDRIANSIAARERYGAPVVVLDVGTPPDF